MRNFSAAECQKAIYPTSLASLHYGCGIFIHKYATGSHFGNREAFQVNPNPFRPDEAILQLLSLTLYNNDFEFNSQFCLQLCGVGMGRKYAPWSNGRIFWGKCLQWMGHIFFPWQHHKVEGKYIHPLLYSRFLDDIFGIWPGSKLELLQFQHFLNSIISGIMVTSISICHQYVNMSPNYRLPWYPSL